MLGIFAVVTVNAAVKRLLHGDSGVFSGGYGVIKHLGAPGLGARETILMDADQKATGCLIYHLHAVIQIGNFFLPKGFGIAGIDGVRTGAREGGALPYKGEKLLHLLHDLQIDMTLRHSGCGDRSAVLPAVSGIQDQNLCGGQRPYGGHGRLVPGNIQGTHRPKSQD